MTNVRIERLNSRGQGVSHGNSFPQTLPGEEISIRADGTFAIQTPSPSRVRPPCPHFKTCGGCELQHASDAFLADWKREFVETACRAQGLDAAVLEPIVSPARSRRRASFAGKRTKKGTIVGFHQRGSDQIVDIHDCLLVDPSILDALPAATEMTPIGASRKGFIRILVTASDAGLDVAVSEAKPVEGAELIQLAAIADRHDLARLSWNGEVIVTRRPPAQMFGAAKVVPPVGGFLQATRAGETALRNAVRDICAGATRIVDLFAGCGTFTLLLAETAEVHAVEGEEAAISALDLGWRKASGLHRVTTEARDLFRRPLMPDELKRFDAAVLDPPRAGAEAQVRQLSQASVPRITMVSCNPASFARDAAILCAAGYGMGSIQVVDQFRWSPHVELVAGFTKAS